MSSVVHQRGSVARINIDGAHPVGASEAWEETLSVDRERQTLLAEASVVSTAAADSAGTRGIYSSPDGSSWKLLYGRGRG